MQMFQWNKEAYIKTQSSPGLPWAPTSSAGSMGSTPDQGTKIPHAMGNGQKINEITNKYNNITVPMSSPCSRILISKVITSTPFDFFFFFLVIYCSIYNMPTYYFLISQLSG